MERRGLEEIIVNVIELLRKHLEKPRVSAGYNVPNGSYYY